MPSPPFTHIPPLSFFHSFQHHTIIIIVTPSSSLSHHTSSHVDVDFKEGYFHSLIVIPPPTQFEFQNLKLDVSSQ
jgi:hypothetical protein